MFFDRDERCLYIVVKGNSNSIESAETEDDYIGISEFFAKKIKEHKCKIGPVSSLLATELNIKDVVNLDNTEQISEKENFVEIPEKFHGIFLSDDKKAISGCLEEIKKIIDP